ncbi:unnamed protein product [Cunninghamella echinulata]
MEYNNLTDENNNGPSHLSALHHHHQQMTNEEIPLDHKYLMLHYLLKNGYISIKKFGLHYDMRKTIHEYTRNSSDPLVKVVGQDHYESNIFLVNEWLTACQLEPIEFCDDIDIIGFTERLKNIQASSDLSNEHRIIKQYSKLLDKTCPKENCDFLYVKNITLEDHLRDQHNYQKLECPNKRCIKTFSFSSSLRYHINSGKHQAYMFKCKYKSCSQEFETEQLIMEHVSDIHDNEEEFVCQECGFNSKYKSLHNKHLLTHTDVKSFKCSNCDAAFARKDVMSRHVIGQ